MPETSCLKLNLLRREENSFDLNIKQNQYNMYAQTDKKFTFQHPAPLSSARTSQSSSDLH
jgi:hypothetical protein